MRTMRTIKTIMVAATLLASVSLMAQQQKSTTQQSNTGQQKSTTQQSNTGQQKNTTQQKSTTPQKNTVQPKVVQPAPLTSHKEGDKAIGGNLILGTGSSFTHFGIGGKFLYNVTDPFRVVGEFDYFLKRTYALGLLSVSWWDFSVYGHYLFPVAEKVALYPSVGLGAVGLKASIYVPYYGTISSPWTSDFAFSLGGGVDYELSPNLMLNFEMRYKITSGGRLNLVAGFAHKF